MQRNTKVLDLVSKGNMDDVETFLSEEGADAIFSILSHFSGLFHVAPEWVLGCFFSPGLKNRYTE